MKKVIIQDSNLSEIHVNALTGREIIAYRTPEPGNGICVLRKLSNNRYGFSNFAYPCSDESFCGTNFSDAVKNASKYRTLFYFENTQDFINAMYLKRF